MTHMREREREREREFAGYSARERERFAGYSDSPILQPADLLREEEGHKASECNLCCLERLG
jgi:hypothetical protein